MAYRRIDDNDTVEIRRAQGGNKPETRTVAELNEYFSKEEPTITAGAPIAPVAATGTAFETNTLTYTARTKGAAGNSIVVNLIDPEKDAEDEVVSVSGSTINVTLASASGAITSDLDAVKAAIEGDTAADALIDVAIAGDGSTIAAEATTQLDNGSDGTTGAAGSLRFDSSNLYVSVDESTIAESNWKSITFNE
ncbi:MAG: hypothetical protein RBR39_09600 [Proteiniphilum sp.]|nr:hypothetical protein [Proteiniphilum sp.]